MKQKPPGLLRPSVNPDIIMMICTAGHVDHGKTELVKLITGCNTDRLKVEQERGLTIELGFAPCYLGDNLCVGIVDVPGHEKFIRNMVAGISGIDLAILVIAADDGVMPQTIEHLQIMELLGVRKGIVALTKTDLVSSQQIEQRTKEIEEFLEGTFLAGAQICPVSSKTFDGYPEFYDTLLSEIKSVHIERGQGVFRMPIERVFSRKGFGTVITGIPIDGSISVGDEIELIPGNQKGKIRGMQKFLREADEGGCGQCLALNVSDFSRNPPERGQVASIPGYLRESSIFHVQLQAICGLQNPIRNAEQIKFQTGTVEKAGKIYLLSDTELTEGKRRLATIVLPELVAASVNDRFILRRPSPAQTVAGGEILAVTYAQRRPRKEAIRTQLEAYLNFFEGADLTTPEGREKKVEYCLIGVRHHGAILREISRDVLLPLDVTRECLSNLIREKKVLSLANDYYISTENYDRLLSEVKQQIEQTAQTSEKISLTIGDIRKDFNLPQPVWNRIIEELEKDNIIQRQEGRFVFRAAADSFERAERPLLTKLLDVYEKTGFKSPRPDQLPAILNVPPEKVDKLLECLCSKKSLVKLSKNVILSYAHFKKAQKMVVKTILEKGVLNSGDFKNCIDSSRKYALAILDFLDDRKVTIREESERQLTTDYQKRLL